MLAGKYRIIEKLGEGGMGVVYKAEDTRLDRKVALKFLPPELMKEASAKERFIWEAKAAAALSHPNICTIYEIDEEEGESFIAMEYIEGESIREKIKKGTLFLPEALDIAIQVAQGLAEAHKTGIIHRDIKSANIMVTGQDQVKVMDFGIAKMPGAPLITREAVMMGTVAYMSPEQARGEGVDHRTDIWSLGVVLYEMLSGQLPFKGENDQAVVYSILNEKPKPITSLRSDIPMALDQIVGKALEKKPADRYQRIEELLDDLTSILEGMGPERIRVRRGKAKLFKAKTQWLRPARSRIFKWAMRAVPVVVGLLLVVGWFLWPFINQPKIPQRDYVTSIAVLFLENLSPERKHEHFSDGLTEELISRLSRIRSLRVVPRTDVLRYKQKQASIQQIARELRVDNLLEGSIRILGERLRVTARCISAKDISVLWTETYDRGLEDIFSVQDEVSDQIVGALNLQLSRKERREVARRPTKNLQAYQLFLEGEARLTQWTNEGLLESIQLFTKAIELDPEFADAHAYLAFGNLVLFYLTYVLDEVSLEKVRKSSRIALRLNPNNQVGLISICGYYMMRVREGRKPSVFELRDMLVKLNRLIRIDPSSPLGQFGVAEYYIFLKRDTVRAQEYLLTTLRRCQEILQVEPDDLMILGLAAQSCGVLGNIAYAKGEFRQAVELTERSIEYMPGIARAYNQLAGFYSETDQEERAIAIRERALQSIRNPVERGQTYLFQGAAYVRLGVFDEAAENFAGSMAELQGSGNALYDYALLYRYLALKRIGAGVEADSILDSRLKSLKDNAWPAPVVRYFTGLLDEEGVLRAATSDWQRCEINYFIGSKELLSGDRARARRFFQECLDTGVSNYLEYKFAKAELERMEGDKR
ncbi:MAG: protein kinase [Clostridiales bacterium]|nr:protein kinase [Clostridiales bacterium]